MSEHALLSPSGCSTWFTCPASVILQKDILDIESEYASQGTLAHTIAAEYLINGKASTVGDLTEEDCIHILDYTDKIKELSQGGTLLVEQRVPLSHITEEPGAEGTADAIIIPNDGKTLEVSDLKFGMGVKVYAKRNKQLMLYALGAIEKFFVLGDFENVILRIHQPRLNHFDEWEVSRQELDDFGDETKFRAQFIWRILSGETAVNMEQDLVPTEEGCRWCKAKAICPALTKKNMALVASDFDDLTVNPTAKLTRAVKKIDTLTNEQLAWVMDNVGLIEDWIKAVRGRVESELFSGRQVPGYKVVQGKKGNRQWRDETEVVNFIKEQGIPFATIYKSSMKSPAELEKVFKKDPAWEVLKNMVVQNEGKPSVAPESDKRPSLLLESVEKDFLVLTTE